MVDAVYLYYGTMSILEVRLFCSRQKEFEGFGK